MKKTGKIVKCFNCQKEIYKSGWQLKSKNGRYSCSKDCGYKVRALVPWNKGLTKETDKSGILKSCSEKNKKYMKQFKTYEDRFGIEKAKKIREKHKKGLKNTDKHIGREKGFVSWNNGLTKETDERVKLNSENSTRTKLANGLRERMKDNEYAKGKTLGENNGNWKGGASFEPYGKEFNNKLREQIRKRDGYRCQQCFRQQEELNKRLSIHHIDFNKKNNTPNNLLSLCTACHSQTIFRREDWIDYFKEMQRLRGII